jgi:hypothetical protein
MISTILLSVAAQLTPCPPAVLAALPVAPVQEQDAELEQRLSEAGDDVAKLLEVATWCNENDKSSDARTIYKRILELDPEHEEAHRALRHHFYDGQWFTSYVALSKYKREEARRMREEHGLVRFGDEWVPEADVPYLRMGWVKSEGGEWESPHVQNRRRLEQEHRDAGHTFRPDDSSWVTPEDADKVAEGLWKCGEEWVGIEEANTFHSQLYNWWRYSSEYRYTILSTCGHAADAGQSWLVWAAYYADFTYPELARAVGLIPAEKPEIIVLKDQAQYNQFGGGDQAAGIPPAEGTGTSSMHYAFFADAFFDGRVDPPEFKGLGVCYWDPAQQAWGPFAIRHAAAHSYLEAVDPSWNSISQAISASQPLQPQTFWGEKKIPVWMRFGLASYCEKFMRNYLAAEEGDPWEFRNWAIGQIRDANGPRPLPEIFAFNIDVNDALAAQSLLNEAGLVVAFILDGGCAEVVAAHEAFKAALKGDLEQARQAAEALQQAVIEHEDDLRLWANL